MSYTVSAVVIILLLPLPIYAQTTHTVCAAGCTYSNTQLQTALNSVACGDGILLQANTIYSGEFILRDKSDCSSNPITLRTGVDANGAFLSASSFPAAGVRITPAYSSVLAKLQTNSNNRPALRTVSPGSTGHGCVSAPCVARGYVIKWIEVMSNSYAGGSLMVLGSNYAEADSVVSGNPQNELAEVASDLVVDQVYLHGDPVKGQRRGLSIHAKNVTIKNSYIKDIKATGSDGQGIALINTPGPITITNNYVEGHSQNLITGGDTAQMNYSGTVAFSPAPTTTTASISNTNALKLNQWVSFEVGGARKSTRITGINGLQVTFSPALPQPPDAPGRVVWSQVVTDLTVIKNHFYKPVEWRDPIVLPPTGVSASGSTTGGSLGPNTYYYRVAARVPIASGAVATSAASTEVSGTVSTGTTGSVTVSWNAVPAATVYRVYGRSSGGQSIYFETSNTSFADTGATGTSGGLPSPSYWTVKTNFELKECDGCLIEGNVIDYAWKSPANNGGYAMWLKVVNQNGDSDSAVTRNVTIRKNLIRHATGAASITFMDVENGNKPSGVMENVSIANNIFHDFGSHWGASTNTFITAVGESTTALVRAAKNFTIDHNTVVQADGTHFWNMNQSAAGQQWPIENAAFTNNMLRRLSNGLAAVQADGSGFDPEGTTSWTRGTTGNSLFAKNVLVDANCSSYPNSTNNYCPTSSVWEGQFVDYSGGNYRLVASSPYKNAGTDGKDLGADIDGVEALTSVALSGDDTGVGTETVLLEDNFSGTSFNTSKWSPNTVWSGATIDTTIPVAQNGRVEIGPLKSNTAGVHYNGVSSASTYDFTGAYAYVHLLQPSSGAAWTMFTAGKDASNFYRIEFTSSTLQCVREIGGIDADVGLPVMYNSTNHQYLRIRHGSGNLMVCETAPDAGGVPGGWSSIGSEAWNTSAVPLTTVRFEMKAGTESSVSTPGSAHFDNFRAAKPQ